jgi:hypothetical protein
LAASAISTAGGLPVPATFENINGGGGKYPSHLCVESFVVAFADRFVLYQCKEEQ